MYDFDTYRIFYGVFFSIELTLNPPEGIIAGPLDEENFFEWEAYIMYVYIYAFNFYWKYATRDQIKNWSNNIAINISGIFVVFIEK